MTHATSRVGGRLLARIHRNFQTRTDAVRFGDSLELQFTRIADPDRVLDEVAIEEDRLERVSGTRAPADQLHLPYWAELWESSLAVGQHLLTHWKEYAGRHEGGNGMAAVPASVLDLGCGMGLAGSVAAALGANVLFADLEPPALLFARLNNLSWRRRVRTRRVNWQTDHLEERFDLILGSDILYERAQWEYLEPFWREHLGADGAVLLGEPGRQTGGLFIPWIRERQWSLQQTDRAVPTRQRPIRLFTLRL